MPKKNGQNENNTDLQKKEFIEEIDKLFKNDKTEVSRSREKLRQELEKLDRAQAKTKISGYSESFSKSYAEYIKRASSGNIPKPEANVTIFSDKMNYEAFLKFLTEKLKFRYNEKYKGNIQTDNSMTRAMFYLLVRDKTGAAEEIIKGLDAGYPTQMRKLYNICLLSVKGQENELNETEKDSLALITDIQNITHEVMISSDLWSRGNKIVGEMQKGISANTINVSKNTINLNNGKNSPNPNRIIINNKTSGTGTKVGLFSQNRINILPEDLSNYQIMENPPEPVVTEHDIRELAALLYSKGYAMEITNRQSLDLILPTLKTNEERLNYFLEMSVDGHAARAWEYPSQRYLPSVIRTCGNEAELKSFYAQKRDKLNIMAKTSILRRLHTIRKKREIAAINEKSGMDKQSLGEHYFPTPAPGVDKKTGKVSLKLKMPKAQTSGNGCWSCGLQMMLLSHGINVEQEDIRSYRPDYPAEKRSGQTFKNNVDKKLNTDTMINGWEVADPALAFAPDRMLRNFEIKMPFHAQEYYGIDRKIDAEKYISNAAALAAEKIQKILNEDKCTISFTNGYHYYAIKSIKGDKITCLDSGNGGETTLSLKNEIRKLYSGTYTEGRPADFSLTWMAKIELDDDGKNFLNVPSHYLTMNEDGSLNLPPKRLMDEQDKFPFEHEGIRVRMVGGMDDSEFDRIKRNPLDKNNLLVFEQAYLPKKLNPNTLKRNAHARSVAETNALKERRIEMLGKNFVAPKYNISDMEIDRIIKERGAVLRYTELLINFKEKNGIYSLKEKEKFDKNGRRLLYNEPGAVLAFRIQKTYEGFKDLFTYMANNAEDEKKKNYWVNHLLDAEQRYREFRAIIQKKENAIDNNTAVPAVYKLGGYLKTREELSTGISFLHSLCDKITMKDFGSIRLRTCADQSYYNPSVLSRFAENVKDFADPNNNGNLLKMCEQNPFLEEAINLSLTFPTTKPQVLKDTFYSTKNDFVTDYVRYGAHVSKALKTGNTSDLKKNYNYFKTYMLKSESAAIFPNLQAVLLNGEKKEKVGELAGVDLNFNLQNHDNIINVDNKIIIDNKDNGSNKINDDNKNIIDNKDKDAGRTESNNGEKKGTDEKNPVLRVIKRREQYRKFLEELEKAKIAENVRKPFRDLGQLFDDLRPYMDENAKQLSYNELKGFLDRYITVQNDMEDFANRELGDNAAYHKFRLVMSKDIRTIHDVLVKNEALSEEEKQNARFSLKDIFEESRAITVTVDEKDIERKGGNLSKRLHIVTKGPDGEPLDGYFTIHEKPYDMPAEIEKHVNDFAGNEKPHISNFVRLLFYGTEKGRASGTSSMLKKKERHYRPYDVREAFKNKKEYVDSVRKAVKQDLRSYAVRNNIEYDSKEYRELESFAEKITHDTGAIDTLVENFRRAYLVDNKQSIIADVGLNPNAVLDKRNAAMSAMASLLKMDSVLAKSTNMRLKIGDKVYKGTFMKTADGFTRDSFDFSNADITENELEKSPELIMSIANLQILDLICANPDRHTGNLAFVPGIVKDDDGNEIKILRTVQGIDNDNSYGAFYGGLNSDIMSATPLSHMLIIPEETADAIRDLDTGLVKAMLVGYDISKEEIDATIRQIQNLKIAIRNSKEYFEKNPTAPLSEKYIKPVSMNDVKNLSLRNDLARENKDPNKEYNIFSKVELFFGFNKSGSDAVFSRLSRSVNRASKEAFHSADVADERMEEAMKTLEKLNPSLEMKAEFEAFMNAAKEQKAFYEKADKRIFVPFEADKTLVECNRNFGPVYDNAVKTLESANTFVTKQTEFVKGLEEGTKEYIEQNAILQNAQFYRNNLERFCNGFKILTEQLAKFDQLMEVKEKRDRIRAAELQKKMSEDEKKPVTEEDEKQEEKTEEKNEEKTEEKNEEKTEEKNEEKNEEKTEEEKHEPVPAASVLEDAEKFITEAETFQNCLQGVKEKLESARDVIRRNGYKNAHAEDYTEDGHEQYRRWTKALEKSINLLNDRNAPLPEIMDSLTRLRVESEVYFEGHYGVFGFPVHAYGRRRLEQSGKLMTELPAMTLTLSNCRKKIEALRPDSQYAEGSLNEILLQAGALKQVYAKWIAPDEIKGRSFEQEKRVPEAQFKAYDKLCEINKEAAKYYRPGNIDECLEAVRKGSGTVAIPYRAEIFSAIYPMNKILKSGIEAKEAEKILRNYNASRCDTYERSLRDNELFNMVQRACFRGKKDTGFSTWAFIEDVADKLADEYKIAKLRNGSDFNIASSVSDAYLNCESSENPHKDGMEAAYERAAEILVNKALSDPKGRKVLQMMAMERSDEKAETFKNYTRQYLLRKDPFCKKGKFMVEKASAYLQGDAYKDILKGFYRQRPEVTLRFSGEYRNMGNEIQNVANPHNMNPALIKANEKKEPLKPIEIIQPSRKPPM